MNRRDLFRAALAGAVSSCLRWLPMPAAPKVEEDPYGGLDPLTYYDASRTCRCGDDSSLWLDTPLLLAPRGSYKSPRFQMRCVNCGATVIL